MKGVHSIEVLASSPQLSISLSMYRALIPHGIFERLLRSPGAKVL